LDSHPPIEISRKIPCSRSISNRYCLRIEIPVTHTKQSTGNFLPVTQNATFCTLKKHKIRRVALLLLAVVFFVAHRCHAQTAKGNGYAAYTTAAKNPKTASAPNYGGVLLGGNGDVDEATQFLCEHSGGGDIVVLRASGADEYNSDFHDACPANSVTSLVITSTDGARDPYVAKTIHDAHAIFISGGDQSNYVRFWSGNPVQKEINAAVARGVPLGGTSAGLAVQGEFAFSAMQDTVTSPEALANPYDPRVTLERDFLAIPQLKGLITDSHFSQRERMGRSIAFLSRIVQDGWVKEVHGIGIDETTAVLVDALGGAHVVGKNASYFMTLDHAPEMCEPGKPLTVRHVKVLKLTAGSHFDLKSWTGSSGTAFEVNVVDGKMTRTDQ
jgi:cyanophycinase